MANPFPFVAGDVLTAAELNGIGEAYIAYTPTITAAVGSFTTVSAVGRYTQVNKIVTGYARITITTNGTAATAVGMTLPIAVSTNYNSGQSIGFGRETQTTGNSLIVSTFGGTATNIFKYDNSYPGGTGNVLTVNFMYEVA